MTINTVTEQWIEIQITVDEGHPKSRRNDGMTERPTEQQLANT